MAYKLSDFIFIPRITLNTKANQLQIKIETERLVIHSYLDKDFENCISLYGNKSLTKYFDNGNPRKKIEVEKLIQEKSNNFLNKGKPYGLFSIFLKKEMNFIGQIDFLPTDECGTMEIGYILYEQFHNQGYATEAVKAFIYNYTEELNHANFKDEEFPIAKIIATVHPKNLPSKKLLEKMGMSLFNVQERFGNPRLWYSIDTSFGIGDKKLEII